MIPNRPIFFHSAIDDADLSASVIRVYCHLSRRDGGSGAWASIPSMAKTCKLNDKTVKKALKELEQLGWVRRERRSGFTDKFHVVPISEWKTPPPIEAPTPILEGVTIEPPRTTQTEPPEWAQKKGGEGSPKKVLHEGSSHKARAEADPLAISHGMPPSARPRDTVLDALATVGGGSVSEVTKSAWGAAAKAKKEILDVSPDTSPDEISRRAGNYRLHFPSASLTASALVKHWARCDKAPAQGTSAERYARGF